jgi:hypothetical protein
VRVWDIYIAIACEGGELIIIFNQDQIHLGVYMCRKSSCDIHHIFTVDGYNEQKKRSHQPTYHISDDLANTLDKPRPKRINRPPPLPLPLPPAPSTRLRPPNLPDTRPPCHSNPHKRRPVIVVRDRLGKL